MAKFGFPKGKAPQVKKGKPAPAAKVGPKGKYKPPKAG
jgi:hypothetical protein